MSTNQKAMTTKDVANQLVSMCREGKIQQVGADLYDDSIVRIEPGNEHAPQTEGKKAVIAQGEQFASMIEEVHGGNISDPVVAGDYFSIAWMMDVTMKGQGRTQMEEVCTYKVKDGKIVWEQFLY